MVQYLKNKLKPFLYTRKASVKVTAPNHSKEIPFEIVLNSYPVLKTNSYINLCSFPLATF